jgi:UDP-N-acetyl-2-amino-2-deoxyglucuronate dehydrogenase
MNFAITGVAGYVAERHLQAIKAVGGSLVAAMDPHDSVGIIDRYFPGCRFFSEFERFDRYLEKLKRKGEGYKIDYLTIASPNYLHDAHVRLALRLQAHAICEKPLVISPWNLDQLSELEQEYSRRVYCILQLRHHQSVKDLKSLVDAENRKDYKVELSYVTPRGLWYNDSWKGDAKKSGGIAMNIGIHFFDMLIWIFGGVRSVDFKYLSENTIKGTLSLDKAEVSWFLSTESKYSVSGKAERSLLINGQEFKFSDGFENLHTKVYSNILEGKGYGIEDVRPAIELTFGFRESAISIQRKAVRLRP